MPGRGCTTDCSGPELLGATASAAAVLLAAAARSGPQVLAGADLVDTAVVAGGPLALVWKILERSEKSSGWGWQGSRASCARAGGPQNLPFYLHGVTFLSTRPADL